MQKSFSLTEGSYAYLLGMAFVVLDNGNSSNWEQVSAWLGRAETLRHEALKKKTMAELYYLKGRFLQKQDQTNAAIVSFRQSRDIYPHPQKRLSKPSINTGLTSRGSNGRPGRAQIPACRCLDSFPSFENLRPPRNETFLSNQHVRDRPNLLTLRRMSERGARIFRYPNKPNIE